MQETSASLQVMKSYFEFFSLQEVFVGWQPKSDFYIYIWEYIHNHIYKYIMKVYKHRNSSKMLPKRIWELIKQKSVDIVTQYVSSDKTTFQF